MSTPHILIIGGGIGGLALAQGLKKHHLPFTIFERDSSPASRAQGYRVRLSGSGPEALQNCLDQDLWDLFEKTCAEIKLGICRLNAVDGTELKGPKGPPGGPEFGRGGFQTIKPSVAEKQYTVDRTMARALLLLGQEGNIKFGKSFERYEVTETGVTAFFSDGSSEKGTLLVGADGLASPVRKQLLPLNKLLDTGSRVLYGKTPITPELTAGFAPEAMKVMTVITDSRPLTLFLEPIRFPASASIESHGQLQDAQDYVYWVLGGSAETVGLTDAEFHSLSDRDAAKLTHTLTEEWHPSLRILFDKQTISQCAPLRLISAKPERPDWKPSARVTLLGDAAHTMLPAGGSGANCAVCDAALLLKLIVEDGVSEDMMGRYLDGMWEYALPAIEKSAMGAKVLLDFQGWENAKEC